MSHQDLFRAVGHPPRKESQPYYGATIEFADTYDSELEQDESYREAYGAYRDAVVAEADGYDAYFEGARQTLSEVWSDDGERSGEDDQVTAAGTGEAPLSAQITDIVGRVVREIRAFFAALGKKS